MVWKRFFGKNQVSPEEETKPSAGALRPRAADPAMEARLDQLVRRRDMAEYDLDRAQAARQPDNPWRERIELLNRSLTTIEDDLRGLAATSPAPSFPLPATPVEEIEVSGVEPAYVAISIGGERFRWEEEPDWDQRGGPVVRGQLRQTHGDARSLVPLEIPVEHRDHLAGQLAESINVLAHDLRDRALEGAPLPESPTLADLARPCPECGGWRDWRGNCGTCAARAFRRQTLLGEAARLAQERAEEEADRAKWAERLSVARKRLADAEAEIAKLTSG